MSGGEQKPRNDQLLDARLHLTMARRGPLSKADKRIQRAVQELNAVLTNHE